MTPAERLARLERMMVLFATHGRRTRNRFNDQHKILLDAQMRNEARFEQLADAQKRLSESQIHTDQRLDALIDIVRQSRPGDSSTR
ncbi:MAG TPA: hypothetical protein VJU84_10070 [Pyrinomonadaceae bacterium]|nr:hypothetical protein [Pyrinomonadaceae bacterium]